MKQSPHAILVIHTDASEGAAKMLSSMLSAKGVVSSSRNERWGFNASMYKVVIAVGAKNIRPSKNVFLLSYKPYNLYAEQGGKLHASGYYSYAAQLMLEELEESRLF